MGWFRLDQNAKELEISSLVSFPRPPGPKGEDAGSGDHDKLPLIVDGDGVFGGRGQESGSSVPGAIFNLATTIIGAGIMALPATMKVLGLLLGFTSIIVMGIVSEISLELLVRFSVHCRSSSYGEVVESALGRPGKILAEICIIVNNAGILVVYLIILGDVLCGSPKHIGVFFQLFGHSILDNRELVICVVLILCLAPLCMLEKIDSLALTSAVSVVLAVVFVLVSCLIVFVKLIDGTVGKPRMGPDFGSIEAILDLLVVIPIMTNAYVCHFNVQPIYNELKDKSEEKMSRVGRITMILCIAIYASTAVSGYLLFGDDTDSDVLANFDRNLGISFSTALNFIVRIGYVLHLILVFPVIHFSLRQTVSELLFKAPLPISRKKSWILTAVLLALIYLGSTTIPNIWVAFKFTGATTGLSLAFIFPALIAIRLDDRSGILKHGGNALSWSMLVLAVLVSIIGVVGNVYSLKRSTN